MSFLLADLDQRANPEVNYNPNLGIIRESTEPPIIIDSYVKSYYTRAYGNACNKQTLDALYNEIECGTRSARKRKFEVYSKVLDQCNKIWERELHTLQHLIPDHNRQRRTEIYDDDYENRLLNNLLIHSITKTSIPSFNRDEFRSELNFDRDRREVGLASLVLFGNLLSNFVSIFSAIYSFFDRKRIEHSMTLKNRDLQSKIVKNRQIASSLFLDSNIKIANLQSAICDSNALVHDSFLEYSTTGLIRENVKSIEREIFSLSLGQIPRNADFFDTVLVLCRNITPNTLNFCRKLLWSDKIDISFQGLTTENGILQALVLIRMPRKSLNYKNYSAERILNFGIWDKTFSKLSLPENVIKTEKFVYGVDLRMCNRLVCPSSAIFIDESVFCYQNFVKNSTEDCVSIRSNPPRCKFQGFSQGFIITASNADIIIDKIRKISLTNQSYILKEEATLVCRYNGSEDTIHNLNPETIYTKSEAKTNLDFKIFRFGNISTIEKIDTDKISIQNRINELEQSDDNLKFNETQFPTFLVILISSLTSIFISICFSYFYSNYNTFKNKFERNLNRLLSWKSDIQNKKKESKQVKINKDKALLKLLENNLRSIENTNSEFDDLTQEIEIAANGKTHTFETNSV